MDYTRGGKTRFFFEPFGKRDGLCPLGYKIYDRKTGELIGRTENNLSAYTVCAALERFEG